MTTAPPPSSSSSSSSPPPPPPPPKDSGNHLSYLIRSIEGNSFAETVPCTVIEAHTHLCHPQTVEIDGVVGLGTAGCTKVTQGLVQLSSI